MMEMEFKPDWNQTVKRFEAWWAGEIIDRVVLQVTAPIQSSTITDTGLGDFPSVPSLEPTGLLTLAALLGGFAHGVLRRRRAGSR